MRPVYGRLSLPTIAPARRSGITGIDVVMYKMTKQLGKMEQQSLKGALEAISIVRQDMDKTYPRIPVKTGALRQSWDVDPKKVSSTKSVITFGFTANYALYVHEMVGSSGDGSDINWSRPGSGPHFFSAALGRNYRKMLYLIGGAIR